MRTVLFVLFIVLMGARLMAKNAMQVEAESSVEPAASSIQPVSLPDAREPQKVIDKKFIAVLGALGAAESLRISTNTLALEHMFAAGAPGVTSAPNPRNVAAKNGLIFASELIVAYELKKPHDWLPGDKVIRKLWWVYPVAMTAIHFKNASDTIRMKPPVGCTSAECQFP